MEDLMERHGLFDKVGAVLDAAESQARAHGYGRKPSATGRQRKSGRRGL